MTQIELDRFKAYRTTIIFDLVKRCEDGLGCQYTLTAINSPVTFRKYSFHIHEGQAKQEIDKKIEEAKDYMTKQILMQL